MKTKFDGIISEISIHAPNEGSDTFKQSQEKSKSKFQSTLPMKGATIYLMLVLIICLISIHAPNEGSDSWKPDLYG